MTSLALAWHGENEPKTGDVEKTITRHTEIVYEMHWSLDDSMLLSGSADGSACVWGISNNSSSPLHVCAFSNFIYCFGSSHALLGIGFDGYNCYNILFRMYSCIVSITIAYIVSDVLMH